MKACFVRWVRSNGLELCSRALSLFLAVVMIANMGTDALGAVLSSHEDLTALVEAGVERAEAAAPVSPDQFLTNLRTELERAMSSENPAPEEAIPGKYNERDFAKKYQQEVAAEYARQEKKLAKEVADALAGFDAQADGERNRVLGGMLSSSYEPGQMAQLEQYIQQERAKYAEYLNAEQAKALAELQAERDNALTKKSRNTAYANYVKEYDKAMEESKEAQLAFYRELVHQVLVNYQQAGGKKSSWTTTENFVSILTYLSSLSNKNDIFVGEDKETIKNELWKYFTVASHACAGGIDTEFRADSQWGSAAIGGSPSAGRTFDVSMNKVHVFRLANEKACNVALSALIPFANLNGEGYKITNFMQDNFDNPLFGQILLVGTKALMLTNNGGISALDAFVDKAIAKENAGAEKTTWDMLDVFTGEGFIKALAFDGKYFSHNVSSAGERNPGEPNVWEDVAEMLVQKNTPAATAILEKAIKQCQVLSVPNHGMYTYPKVKQQFNCKGIYPFLFGVITQKPELVQNMFVQSLFPERAGKYQGANGKDFIVTEQEASNNRIYNRNHGLEYKVTKGELLAGLFYHNMFEDLYPADKQRMDSKLAAIPLLNPKGQMKGYSTSSERYKKLQNKFNAKIVFVALGAVFDYAISLLLFKDVAKLLFKAGALVKGATSALKVRQVIMGYKLVPNSLGKSAMIAHALQAKNLGLVQLKSYKAFVTKISNIKTKAAKIRTYPSKVVERFREAHAPQFHFENPTAAEFGGAATRADTPLGGARGPWTAQDLAYTRAAWRSSAEAATLDAPQISNFRDFYSAYLHRPLTGAWGATKGAWNFTKGLPGKAWHWVQDYARSGGATRYTKESSGGTPLRTQDLTVTLRDVKGNPVEIKDISVKGGVLYINGTMAKTFKAYLPMDRLEALAALSREEQVGLGFDGMWVKLVSKGKASRMERLAALDKDIVTVPLYDAAGNPMLHVGFNSGYKAQKALLDMLQGENPAARLVFKDGKIHLFNNADGTLIRVLDEFEEISIPKTAFNNVMKGEKFDFLNRLFALDKGTSGALRLEQTNHKLFFPMLVNTLSFSAGASALTLSLQQEPFNFSAVGSMAASMTLPYATSFLAPFFAPLVTRFGARRIMNSAFVLSTASLATTLTVGNWRGHGGDKDENDKPIGNISILMMNAFLTGLSSTLIRASSGVMIKGYELGEKTLTKSMAWKSVGGLTATAVPYAVHLWNSGVSWATGKEPAKDVDFSSAYWVLAGGSVLALLGLRATMPKMAKPGYKLSWGGVFKEPLRLLGKPEVWPYVGGMTLMSTLESYAFFTGISKWNRDHLTGKDWSETPTKFWAAVFTAVPQFVARTRLFSGALGKTRLARTPWYNKLAGGTDLARKSNFGKGAFNSAVLAMTGTGLFMLDPENPVADVGLGLASGFLIGKGTANIFQYNQKLLMKSVKAGLGADKVPMAQVIYSGSNIGLAIPLAYAIAADTRKKEHPEEDDLTGVRKTVWMPLVVYALGGSLILGAERNWAPVLKHGFQWMGRNIEYIYRYTSPVLNPLGYGALIGANLNLRAQQVTNPQPQVVVPPLNLGENSSLNLSMPSLQLDTPSLTSPLLHNPLQGNGQSGFQMHLMDGQSLLNPLPPVTLPAAEPTPAQ